MPKVQSFDHEKGGHSRRGRRTSTSLAEINVVPLVDVMLVLLIIFMVTAPMMQQGVTVNLPQARRSDPINSQPIYVTIPAAFSTTKRLMLDKEEIGVEALGERLKQALLTREDKSIFLRPDQSVTVQDLFTVYDRVKEAGVQKIGMVSQPPKQ